MTKYLLSVHTGGEPDPVPMSETEMQESWERLSKVEEQMRTEGAWFFSGRLHDPDTATVVRVVGDDTVTTDGPFVEAKEHIAGFYVIEAPDLDAALGWASQVTACIKKPLEVRPFVDTSH